MIIQLVKKINLVTPNGVKILDIKEFRFIMCIFLAIYLVKFLIFLGFFSLIFAQFRIFLNDE